MYVKIDGDGHTNPKNSRNHHDEIARYQGISKGTHNDTQLQNSAHPENSPTDCGDVQLVCMSFTETAYFNYLECTL